MLCVIALGEIQVKKIHLYNVPICLIGIIRILILIYLSRLREEIIILQFCIYIETCRLIIYVLHMFHTRKHCSLQSHSIVVFLILFVCIIYLHLQSTVENLLILCSVRCYKYTLIINA